jgi:acyl dehydratase
VIRSHEELEAGLSLPVLEREIDSASLVRYAGASGDYSPQHWDHLYMVERGFPGVIVHGWFTFAVMCQAVQRLIPPETAELHAFSVRYHRPQRPGRLACGGEVVALRVENAARLADIELWAKDADDALTASGTATLKFFQGGCSNRAQAG